MDPQTAQQYASNLTNNSRCPPSNNEANNWLKKTNAVHKAIRGLTNGTLDVDQINLKKYGILNEKEEAEEKERKARVRQELATREAQEKKRLKEKERQRWWNDAILIFGENGKMNEVKSENKNEDKYDKQQIIARYSSNYTRWSESNYKPDDEASKEEAEQSEQENENKLLTEFESNNTEWCNKMSDDIHQRKEQSFKKQQDADKKRTKGNFYFQRKEYDKALSFYFKAFEMFPFEVIVLTNMAMCYGKLHQVDDAIEFCNRACYVDKSYIKAFYHRALSYIQKKCFDDALNDLETCRRLDSESLVAVAKHEWLMEEIKCEALEARIRRVVIDNNNTQCDLSNDKSSTGLSVTHSSPSSSISGKKLKPKIDVGTLQMLSHTKDSELIDHCNTVDEIMNKIKKNNLAQDVDNSKLNIRHSFGVLSIILIELMESRPFTKTYFRISGHLENICRILLKNEGQRYILRKILYDIISASVIGENRSMEVVIKNKIIFAAVSSVNFDVHTKDDCNSTLERISAAKIILILRDSFDSSSGQLYDKSFRKHKELVLSICSLITDICKVSIDEKESAVIICSNLLSFLCNKFEKHKFWKEFSSAQHLNMDNPIATISKALLYFKGDEKYKEIRSDLVEAIVNISRIKEMRLLLSMPLEPQEHQKYSLCCIHVLLCLAKSYKSEEEKCRNFALMALTNSTVKGMDENNYDSMKIYLCQCRAVPVLFDLSTSSYSSMSIKLNASELLGRCIGVPQGIDGFMKCHNSVPTLIKKISTFVLDDNWLNSNLFTSNSKCYGNYVVNLISILSRITKGPFDDAYYKVLISLLPLPRRIKGKVTAQSICQASEIPVKGSAYEVAISNRSFYVNISKALLVFLDSNKKGTSFLLSSKDLVERLICILANYSSMHPLFVKNTACVLARLVTYSIEIRMYCKELRGMEILMELGKKGII